MGSIGGIYMVHRKHMGFIGEYMGSIGECMESIGELMESIRRMYGDP